MKTISELVKDKINLFNMNRVEAESYVCQEIIINKIAKSELVDKTFLKGGVVLFNMSKNERRTTRDIDFDLAHYDISTEESMKNLVYMLNKRDSEYVVTYIKSDQLHQDDYKGRRLYLKVSDKSATLKITIDVGVHTLFAIDQVDSIFTFNNDNNKVVVKVNPPEQMIAEKLYSLAKHTVVSQRYRDLYDVYYLLKNTKVEKEVVRQCFELLLINNTHGFNGLSDVVSRIDETLSNEVFKERTENASKKWIDIDYLTLKETILNLLYSI